MTKASHAQLNQQQKVQCEDQLELMLQQQCHIDQGYSVYTCKEVESEVFQETDPLRLKLPDKQEQHKSSDVE